MYPTKGYWLWMDNPGTLITLNAPWADDYQFSYEDLSTIPTAETAANEQSIIAYGGMPHTNSDASYAYNRITNDSIFFFNGHGIRSRDDGEHGGGLSFWNGTDKTIIAAEHIDAPLNTTTYYIAEFNDQMNDVLLAVYVACWSGRTSAHLGNLVTMTHSKGADNVIGFTEELLNPQSNYWSDRFWYRCRAGSILGTPQTIPTAAQSAKTDVLIAFYPYTGGVSSLIGEYHSDGGVYDYLIPARYGTN